MSCVEDPSVPLSAAADEDVYDALAGGRPTGSGVRVNRTRALGYSAVWRAVNLIAGDVGRLPLHVYRRVGAGKEPDDSHPAYRLLRRKPNPYMTAFTFRQTLQAHALMNGNGYAVILRGPDMRPRELLILSPESTWPVRANGELWYVGYTAGDRKSRQMVKLPATDVIHIRGLGFDGLCGYPVLKVLRETLGKAIAARDYGARYFKNDARPGVVLEVPAGMKDTAVENLRRSWQELHQGYGNAHRPAVLRDGVRLGTSPAGNAKDAQLIENLTFDAREIANVFGVPPHKLGDPSRTAYNSLESENQSYFDDTLDRWLTVHEEEYWDKLLSEAEKAADTHTVEFSRQALLRANLSARGAYYSQAVNGGWLSRDEVRGMENLNPIPGGKGAEFVLAVNVQTLPPTPVPAPTDGPEPPQADPGEADRPTP